MTQTSHSRQKPWDGRAAGRDDTEGVRGSEQRPARRHKPRRSRLPIVLLTGTLLTAAGSGAGVLIYPDRVAEFLREPEWMKPSAAWSVIFPEWSPAARSGVARADIVPAAAPVQMDAARFAAAQAAHAPPVEKPMAQAAAASTKAGGRDLPWLPDQTKPAEAPAAEPPQTASGTATPEAAATASASRPSPPAPLTEEIIDLMKRAGGHVEMGDIAGARLLLERAAAGREPNALMALAETYDPAMLARWGARGLKGDLKKARELYQAAAESGLAEARTRVLAVR